MPPLGPLSQENCTHGSFKHAQFGVSPHAAGIGVHWKESGSFATSDTFLWQYSVALSQKPWPQEKSSADGGSQLPRSEASMPAWAASQGLPYTVPSHAQVGK